MKPREKILAGVVGAMALAYVGNWMFGSLIQGPLKERRERVAKLEGDIKKKNAQLLRAKKNVKKLAEWRQTSLPTNLEVATSLYQDWLLELVAHAEFKMPNVDTGEATGKKGAYHRLPFSVRGRATLEQLTRFLYDFYHAGHLHQIQRVSLHPVPKSRELDISLSIEALVLPSADRTNRLNARPSTRLASESLEDYQVIGQRNLFGEGGSDSQDPADFAVLSAIPAADGEPQAWFILQTTGEVLKLRAGEILEIGNFRGRIAAISPPDVIIDSDEERWLLTLGEKLSRATALPPDF